MGLEASAIEPNRLLAAATHWDTFLSGKTESARPEDLRFRASLPKNMEAVLYIATTREDESPASLVQGFEFLSRGTVADVYTSRVCANDGPDRSDLRSRTLRDAQRDRRIGRSMRPHGYARPREVRSLSTYAQPRMSLLPIHQHIGRRQVGPLPNFASAGKIGAAKAVETAVPEHRDARLHWTAADGPPILGSRPCQVKRLQLPKSGSYGTARRSGARAVAIRDEPIFR